MDNCEGGIKIGGLCVSNLRCADDTTIIKDANEELGALLKILAPNMTWSSIAVKSLNRRHGI